MTVRFGIIGPGSIANRFAGVLQTADGVSLQAVASSTSLDRAQDFADKYGAESAYGSYEQLVRDENVDVVYIGLTHNFHAKAIRLCLNHGKGVICEKPMTISEKDARELTSLAKEKKVLLMEAMWTRFLPAFKQAKEWVQSGRIGDVKYLTAAFGFDVPFDPEHRLYNPKLAGGSLLDAGVYPIEFATGILSENPKEVCGVLHECETGVDDFVAMSLKFDSGALANLSCGLTAKVSWDAVIYGNKGRIVVEDFLMTKKCSLYDVEDKLVDVCETEFDDGFIFQIEHFADLYRQGKIESDLIPHADNIACGAIFDTLLNT